MVTAMGDNAPEAYARSCVGVPFLHMGRTRRGMDCVGLVIYVGGRLGFPQPSVPHYRRVQNPRLMLRLCRQHLVEVSRGRRSAWDHAAAGRVGVFYGSPRSHQASHMGIFGRVTYPDGTDHLSLIHSVWEKRQVVEELADAWAPRLIAVFDWPEA